MTGSADIHRGLPHSVEAEQGVLGSMLISPRDVIAEAVGKINENHFYIPAHQTIYAVLVDLWSAGQGIDLITFTQVLRDRRLLDTVGGASLVTALFTFVPTAANVGYYLEIMRDKYILREIISVCTEMARRAYEEYEDAAGISALAQTALLKLTDVSARSSGGAQMSENVMLAMERMQDLLDKKNPSGLTTGLSDLDAKLGGLHPGEVIVIAGDTAGGKTTLAHNIADHVGVDLGKTVQIFSYEMPALMVTNRMLAARARVNTAAFQTGRFSATEFTKIEVASAKLAAAPIFIEDNPDMTIEQLRARARRLKSSKGTELIVVDYVQKVPSDQRRSDSRQREVAANSDALQKMAMELGVSVIVLSQLNEDGRVREARDIAFDAKTVLKIVRNSDSAEEEEEALTASRLIVIAKNSNGPTGAVRLTFVKQFTKFESFQHD
ncbi:MAG: replicative DNA helicase [Nitrospirota bacterium]